MGKLEEELELEKGKKKLIKDAIENKKKEYDHLDLIQSINGAVSAKDLPVDHEHVDDIVDGLYRCFL